MDTKLKLMSKIFKYSQWRTQKEFSYQYTGMGTQILVPKEGNIPWFTVIFFIVGCFFLLELSKVCFQVRKHVLSIVNHSKDKNMCSLKGLYPIDTHQHFNMELLSALQSLQNHLCQKIMSKKPLCPKKPLVMPLIVILACCLKFPVDTKTLHQYIARIKQFFARFSLEIFNFFTE